MRSGISPPFADRIDRLNTAIGRAASWCALFIVLISFAVVLLRYVLGLGSIWLQESILYAHAALFLLAAAWTLKEGGHVRVDVFYADAVAAHEGVGRSAAARCCCCCRSAWRCSGSALPYVARSWAILERSRETSGLPLVFLLKTLIPLSRCCWRCRASRRRSGRRVLTMLRSAPQAAKRRELMPLPELLAILMVVAVCGLLFAGYPVALTLGGVSLAFAVLGHSLGAMDFGLLYALPQRIFGVMTNTVLLAIPLFIFMGVMLERSRIAEDLLETMGRLFGSLPGGLGISVVLVGVLLAAAKGVVGATVVTIALITLPTMLRHGYDKRARRRHGGGHRDAGADLAARDRAGAARRPAQQSRIRPRSSPRASSRRVGVGQRSVRRRDRAGA